MRGCDGRWLRALLDGVSGTVVACIACKPGRYAGVFFGSASALQAAFAASSKFFVVSRCRRPCPGQHAYRRRHRFHPVYFVVLDLMTLLHATRYSFLRRSQRDAVAARRPPPDHDFIATGMSVRIEPLDLPAGATHRRRN